MSLPSKRAQSWRLAAKSAYIWLAAFGFHPLTLRYAFQGLVAATREYVALKRQNRAAGRPFRIRFSMPCLGDRYQPSGTASGHYFFQDFLVARRIFERNPIRHVDVGSRIDGFVAHVAAFREVEVFDIRPLTVPIPSIVFRQNDLMNPQVRFTDYCDSLSCLHAIEHFGLGRYGDPIDLFGHVKGFASLVDILKPGGTLYFSVPIGPECVNFNACRVLSIRSVLKLAEPRLELKDFSYVDDAGNLHESVALSPERIDDNCACQYGCGVFEFRKLSAEAKAP
jgi:SAM-dependent methyltransferase